CRCCSPGSFLPRNCRRPPRRPGHLRAMHPPCSCGVFRDPAYSSAGYCSEEECSAAGRRRCPSASRVRIACPNPPSHRTTGPHRPWPVRRRSSTQLLIPPEYVGSTEGKVSVKSAGRTTCPASSGRSVGRGDQRFESQLRQLLEDVLQPPLVADES